MCFAWRNYVSSWGCNYYYGPLYGQGLVPDYLPGCDQASQRQPVNTVTLDTGTGTRSSSHNEPSHLASITLKVINPANKKDMNYYFFYWDIHVTERRHKNSERRLWNNMETKCHMQSWCWVPLRTTDGMDNDWWWSDWCMEHTLWRYWFFVVRKSAKQLDSSGEESGIPDEPPLKKAKTHRVYLPLRTNRLQSSIC